LFLPLNDKPLGKNKKSGNEQPDDFLKTALDGNPLGSF
jgi:hypothetical protein